MTRAILIDRVLGETIPSLATDADVQALEAVPFRERIEPASTYEALRLGAAHDPTLPAIQFLPNADPDEAALIVSHGDFIKRVTQAANLFTSLGVGPSDVVSLMVPLLPQSLYALFGAEAAGIANPVNPLLEPHQIAGILQAANTKVLVALGPTPGVDIWEKVLRLRNQVPTLKAIVQIGGAPSRSDGDITIVNFDAVIDDFPGDHLTSGRTIGRDDIAAYFHTGGTTGTPKLVRHTHENQVSQAWACNLMLRQGAGHRALFGLPLYHVGGALTQALTSLTQAGSLIILSPAGWRNPSAIRNAWRLVERFKPYIFGSVPTVLGAVAAVPSEGVDTSSFKGIFGGGSAIPVAVGAALAERFAVPVLEVYGMTEVSSVHTMSYGDRPVRLGSTGHPLPYSRLKIVKLDGQGRYIGDCKTNEVGVIALSGPGAFAGYLNEAHNKGAFIEPGWVNSGDLGRLDEEGYLWITGRAKDLIIRGAHNIDPLPIEEILYEHPDVLVSAVIGQPDAYAGEVPLAYVQLKPGAKASAAELLDYMRQRTPERAAVPVAVRLVDTIPLTGVGKVFKPQLRWDATQHCFEQVLAPLAEGDVKISVNVGQDERYGTLARVRIDSASGKPLPAELREDIERRARDLLSPFTIRSEIVEVAHA